MLPPRIFVGVTSKAHTPCEVAGQMPRVLLVLLENHWIVLHSASVGSRQSLNPAIVTRSVPRVYPCSMRLAR
jgi:hypothetical protein